MDRWLRAGRSKPAEAGPAVSEVPRWGPLTEPDVALTDYGLAIESALLGHRLYHRPGRYGPLRRWFGLFFGSVGVASLAGGTTHGFFLDKASTGQKILWPTTLVAIGVTALASWAIGARVAFAPPTARRVTLAAGAAFAAYCGVVLGVKRTFAVAIVDYLPATIFLFGVFAREYARTRERAILAGLVGVALAWLAAGVQQGKVGLHPRYCNHNALYHLIQAVSLFLFYRSGRRLVAREAESG